MSKDKKIGFLKSVEIFGNTMGERFINRGQNNSMLIIASDGEKSLQIAYGSDDELLDALSTVLYMNAPLCELVHRALGLVLMSKVNNTEITIDNDED